MPKQANREDMLRRWSTLAPGECAVGKTGISVTFAAGQSGWCAISGASFAAVLLSALIEAVRARRWGYCVTGTLANGNCDVCITLADDEYYDAEADEPCDALLAAYISALEGVDAKAS